MKSDYMHHKHVNKHRKTKYEQKAREICTKNQNMRKKAHKICIYKKNELICIYMHDKNITNGWEISWFAKIFKKLQKNCKEKNMHLHELPGPSDNIVYFMRKKVKYAVKARMLCTKK